MRSTLFFIPHELAGIPLFGFGWLLGCLVVAALVWVGWSLSRKLPASELLAALPVWFVALAIVTIVLPRVEQVLPSGDIAGLPIRGYGVMVLLGLLSGIGITVHRGRQLGIIPDTIIGLGFWMMLGGIVGARLFYVVQKWDDHAQLGLWEKLVDSVKLTEGGLVIYGGVVGGLIAGAFFCSRNKLNVAATADLIAPGFLIGLSIGRLGCLLHGCCFGGVCTAELPAMQFPAGSLPYNSQLSSGQLLGIELQGTYRPPGKIAGVHPGSLAERAHIQPGEQLEDLAWGLEGEPSSPTAPPPVRAEVVVSGERTSFSSTQLPPWSLPTHPSQIYAAINALLLCLLVWNIQPVPRRDGATFLIAIVLYAFSRFLLECVRSDEAGQFGTPFTIAQLIALGSGTVALLALLLLSRLPPARVWAWPGAEKI